MAAITIDPGRLKQFGPGEGADFYFVTNPRIRDQFELLETGDYRSHNVLLMGPNDNIVDRFGTEISDRAHIFCILPDTLFHSIHPDILTTGRKLSFMACNSAPTPVDAVEHFLRTGGDSDPVAMEACADRFFERGEQAETLRLVDEEYGTEAVFEHWDDRLEWHEQFGPIDWGGQQVFPAGEIACFIVPLKIQELDPSVKIKLNGTLAIKGTPLVHIGTPSYLPEDQERIFRDLLTANDHAVIATVEDGVITAVEATDPGSRPAAEMLDALFTVDSRFRQIFEIGFSINPSVGVYPGNTAMNEIAGGKNGSIHYGIGMLPHCQYHIDLACPNTKVLGKDGEAIFGGLEKRRSIRRQKSAQCPCLG